MYVRILDMKKIELENDNQGIFIEIEYYVLFLFENKGKRISYLNYLSVILIQFYLHKGWVPRLGLGVPVVVLSI